MNTLSAPTHFIWHQYCRAMKLFTPTSVALILILSCLHIQIHCSELITINAANLALENDEKNGLRLANFRRKKGKQFHAPRINVVMVKKEKACVSRCLADPKCVSCNAAAFANAEGRYQCELLGEFWFNKVASLKSTNDFNHHYIKVNYFPLEQANIVNG